MPLENATTISGPNGLNPSYPTSSDEVGLGDDHVRLLKAVLTTTFPNIAGVASASHTDLTNLRDGIVKLADGSAAAPSLHAASDPDTGLFSPAANQLAASVGGSEVLRLQASGISTPQGVSAGGTVAAGGAITSGSTITAGGKISSVGAANGFSGPGVVPVGGTLIWWDDTLPDAGLYGRYAWANGQTVLASENPVLAGRWTSRLESGGTLIRLPDLRETAPVGKSAMGGAASPGRIVDFVLNTLGAIFGTEKKPIAQANLPDVSFPVVIPAGQGEHNHATTAASRNSGSRAGTSGSLGDAGGVSPASLPEMRGTATSGGSGTPLSVLQPGTVCNYVIRLG